jgi:A/G-specific adenine glycosylase
MSFSKDLIQWYLINKRDLPWRNTENPYFIWLSEIMLQQTRVAQGTPYYLSFTANFPTVFDLANASEQDVLKLWQGLGYYSRARNLHKTAHQVAYEFNGIFPNNYAALLKLKGVGEYTAAAIASFAFNETVAVVDGNVFRVLSRYFDIDLDISIHSTKKEFQKLAFSLLPKGKTADFNQAIMEFGALQCVPKSPNCGICVLNNSCLALQKKKVNLLPVKTKKVKVTNRFLNYLIFEDSQLKILINQRTDKGIWHNLYEFPLLETEKLEDFDCISQKIIDDFNHDTIVTSISELNPIAQIHKLTHQHLHIKFWKVKVKGNLKSGITVDTLKNYPFPIVLFNFIENKLLVDLD